jgi:predicted amidohydrolase
MNHKKINHAQSYRIKLQGTLDPGSMDWFGDITVLPQENGETVLVGLFRDQAALRGFVDQLWNLNFTVLSVERIDPQNNVTPDQQQERR